MKRYDNPTASSLFEQEWQQLLGKLDIDYAYRFAKRMEEFKTNPALGYRTAGSPAERKTGDMIVAEMQRLGLRVSRDVFAVDGWNFHHARLFWGPPGQQTAVELGGYQTQMDTGGPKSFSIINVGKGTAAELEGLDLSGKLALVVIDQRNEWWINYPAYLAHLRGAAAILAIQSQGYGEFNARTLNAQDICGPADAPAFSISKHDAKALVKALGLTFGKTAEVIFDALSIVTPNVTACNITGIIDGVNSDAMVLMSAHYDSYFQGFQDDNTAVGMMLSIAKAIKESHLRPRKALVFCVMAAEEWGACNTQYDWSTGAYNQIFRLHPEWVGKAIADINLELPARQHSKRHMIRSVFEYKPFLKAQLHTLPPHFASPYPNGVGIISPVQSWSDDFSMALAGVPSMVNEFGTGSFMETHYHSQFDNDGAYDREAYEFHHRLYSRLLLAFDCQMLPPLHFGPRLEAMGESLTDQNLSPPLEGSFRTALDQALADARALYRLTERLNEKQRELLLRDPTGAAALDARLPAAKNLLLEIFRFCQEHFVALDWYDEAMLPHEVFQYNIEQLRRAIWQLAAHRGADAFSSLCNVDNNRYAIAFGREVYDYFTRNVLAQPPERLFWGAGRIQGHMDLFELLQQLDGALRHGQTDFPKLIEQLQDAIAQQHSRLEQAVACETDQLVELDRQLILARHLLEGPARTPKAKKGSSQKVGAL